MPGYVVATDEEPPPLSDPLACWFAATVGASAVLGAPSLAALVAGEAVGRALPLLEVGSEPR